MEVPLSADFRYYFSPGKYAAPFINLYGGYAFAEGKGYDADNVFIGLNLGVNIIVAHNMSLQMALGVKAENYNYHSPDIYNFRSADNITMPFTIGLSF